MSGGAEPDAPRAAAPSPTWLCCLAAAALLMGMAGCTSTRVTQTGRSGIEQQLLVRSLERAVARLDLDRFAGRRVALDLFALTPDQPFAKEFVTSWLEARGAHVVREGKEADLRLKMFASVLGVDYGETLVGVPAFVAPVVAFPIPEIALFKWVRNRGNSEVQIFAYDARTDRLLDVSPAAVGKAKYDEFTILIVFGFGHNDLDERLEPTGPRRTDPRTPGE